LLYYYECVALGMRCNRTDRVCEARAEALPLNVTWILASLRHEEVQRNVRNY